MKNCCQHLLLGMVLAVLCGCQQQGGLDMSQQSGQMGKPEVEASEQVQEVTTTQVAPVPPQEVSLTAKASEIQRQINIGNEHVPVGQLTWVSAERGQATLLLSAPVNITNTFLASRDSQGRLTAIFRTPKRTMSRTVNLELLEGFPMAGNEVVYPSRAVLAEITQAHSKPEALSEEAEAAATSK